MPAAKKLILSETQKQEVSAILMEQDEEWQPFPLGGRIILPELCLPRVVLSFRPLCFRRMPDHFYRKPLALSSTFAL